MLLPMKTRAIAMTAGALIVALCSCYPAMAHPTRVGSGFSVISTLGVHVAEDEDVLQSSAPRRHGFSPTFGLSAALSVRDTSATADGPGFRFSVGTGFAMPVWQAYMELPRGRFGDLDAGAGIALHGARPRLVMPYLQAGRQFGERRSWFSQQGFAFGSTANGRSSGVLWIPTVAIASGLAGGEASVFLTGVIGGRSSLHQEICSACTGGSRVITRNLLIAGVSWGQIVISNLPVPREP
jgi:hypothetical protein